MNTIELAQQLTQMDMLEPILSKHEYAIIQDSATMLRQLQAEIEELKAENKFFKDLMGDVEILVKGQEK